MKLMLLAEFVEILGVWRVSMKRCLFRVSIRSLRKENNKRGRKHPFRVHRFIRASEASKSKN